ncbi:MAG: hypothetical protein M9955_19745 [Rhizobiaceae bacterium]|nr:hypothetical protein [Rhizobiaceae bacterium]
MRLAVFALILLASTSVTFGDDLLVRKVSAALDKAKVCGFEVDEIRLAEAMNIATMAQSTQVRTIDENAPNVIEVPPPPPPSASTGPAEAEEPEGPVPLSLGCQKLLKEFGPDGIVFAGLLRDELACCRFRGHRDKVFDGTGEWECREGSSAASSNLRR